MRKLLTRSHIDTCYTRLSTMEYEAQLLNGFETSSMTDRNMSSLTARRVCTESLVTSGVPQGSVLGSLLFLIFINDLPACISSSTTRLFANDSVTYRNISEAKDAEDLQSGLNALQDWEAKWIMRFNAKKFQVLRVTNKRHPIASSYTIHGHTLDVVDSAKYLGVHLDSHLNFNSHVDAVTKKANNTRAFLSRNLGHCSRKIKEAAFTTFVRPTVEYASTSWDPHTQKNVKKVEQVLLFYYYLLVKSPSDHQYSNFPFFVNPHCDTPLIFPSTKTQKDYVKSFYVWCQYSTIGKAYKACLYA